MARIQTILYPRNGFFFQVIDEYKTEVPEDNEDIKPLIGNVSISEFLLLVINHGLWNNDTQIYLPVVLRLLT